MAVYGKKLLDSEGNTILPKTRASLVYTSDDKTVENVLNSIIDGTTRVGRANEAVYMRDANSAETRFLVTQYAGDASRIQFVKGDGSGGNLYPNGRDDTKMPLAGGTFTGWVTCNSGFTTTGATYFQGVNNFGGTATFNNDVHLGGKCSIAQDKSPGNGSYVQASHIPNISQNIRYIIYWT